MLPVTPQSHSEDAVCGIALSLLPASSQSQLARKELNLRPASYKDAALTAELRASELGRRDSNPHQPD
jgi:hypothetical protein